MTAPPITYQNLFLVLESLGFIVVNLQQPAVGLICRRFSREPIRGVQEILQSGEPGAR